MHKRARLVLGLVLSVVTAVLISACGSSGSSTTSTAKTGGAPAANPNAGKQGGTATIGQGTFPDFLDPQEGYTTQAAQADWITYTPLLTYKHANGQPGTQLIPGLATALPKITDGGKTYTLTLRKGLVYSNGKPVKASDFAYTIKRLIHDNWGGKSFVTGSIVGAAAYDKAGKANGNIPGITTDDATGKITIKLTAPFGPFANVIAFPSAGLVPTGTAFKNLTSNPPPGVGAYKIVNVKPGRAYELVKNPKFNVPGIPRGFLNDIKVTINNNAETVARQVLSNQVDNFDSGDTVPGDVLPQIKSQASDRFAALVSPSTFYFFLNTKLKPFNNVLARQAVNYAIDKRALSRLDGGFLKPSCFFLPVGIPGHTDDSKCPYGNPNAAPNVAKAKALVKQSGLAGTPITVWGEERAPRDKFITYYADVLNKIGFKATPKIINSDNYFQTIGNFKTKAQTGFADWLQDFPNPYDFLFLTTGSTVQKVNNENFSNVTDPKIGGVVKQLGKLPLSQLQASAPRYAALDQYQIKQAYVAVYGSEELPKFLSNRIDFQKAVFHPLFLNDWSTWQLK